MTRFLKTLLPSFLLGFGLYFVGLFGCLWLMPLISSNSHDVDMEAAMTGGLVIGPVLALTGFIAGMLLFRKRKGRGIGRG